MDNPNTFGQPPKSWLIESILVTIFCCLPLGIVGIIHASKVENRFYAGDIEGAQRASLDAGKWTKITFFTGIAINVIFVILWFTVLASMIAAQGGF